MLNTKLDFLLHARYFLSQPPIVRTMHKFARQLSRTATCKAEPRLPLNSLLGSVQQKIVQLMSDSPWHPTCSHLPIVGELFYHVFSTTTTLLFKTRFVSFSYNDFPSFFAYPGDWSVDNTKSSSPAVKFLSFSGRQHFGTRSLFLHFQRPIIYLFSNHNQEAEFS